MRRARGKAQKNPSSTQEQQEEENTLPHQL